MDAIELVIHRAPKGRYRARWGERGFLSAREPLFAAARILAGEGRDPQTTIWMRYADSGVASLQMTLGQAAKLAVNESCRDGKPRIVPYRPFYRT